MWREEFLVEWMFGYRICAMAVEVIRDPALRNDRNGAHSLIPQMPSVPKILVHRSGNRFGKRDVPKYSARDGHHERAVAPGGESNGIERFHPACGVKPCLDELPLGGLKIPGGQGISRIESVASQKYP